MSKRPNSGALSARLRYKIMKYTKYSSGFLPCLAKKSLAVGHSAIYQTSPG
jgi:hypothetical protein